MAHRFVGVDVNREISLMEYGFIAQKNTKDYPDEYFVIYHMDNDAFGTGYVRESDLDSLIKGEEWAEADSIKSFLSFVGSTLEEWLELEFVTKLSDCLNYWGYADVIGMDYSPMSESDVYKQYRHLFR
jgi:hypothetical protein